MSNATERAPYLEAGDAVLMPLGFKRKKREYEWRRAVDRDVEWIHLNFGRAVINPSFGVSYVDLNSLLPPEVGVRCGQHFMLLSLTGTSYSSDTSSPNDIALDLQKAVSEFPQLHDREAFIQILMSDKAPTKQVLLFSHRIRTLPLMLATSGRLAEALDCLARFEASDLARDQMVPGYDVYASHFRKKYANL